jgi:TonB family protein
MMLDRGLNIALIVSLAAHLAVFLNFNLLHLRRKAKAPKEKPIAVSYIRVKDLPQETGKRGAHREPLLQVAPLSSLKDLPPLTEITKKEPAPLLTQDALPKDYGQSKPALLKVQTSDVKRKISLPPMETPKVNSPTYVNYSVAIRGKIQEWAYKNYTGTDSGVVVVSFLVTREGLLKSVKISEKESTSNAGLRDIAVKSIKDAAPFATFPQDLDYPELSFNLMISFEIE